MKSALILYPHQLFPLEQIPGVDAVLLVEDPLFFGIDRQQPVKLHKQKLILHRASMRRYVEEVLWPAGLEVEYVELDGLMTSEDIFDRAKKFDQLYVFDTIDDVLTKRLLEARRANNSISSFEFLSSPNFYLKNQEIQSYFDEDNKHSFEDFYQWQRERFNVLIGEDYKPVGGAWTLEQKPQKLEVDTQLPSFAVYGSNKFVEEAVGYVEKHFPENPGTTDFIWPTNHQEAQLWLDSFIEHRLENYAKFQIAIDNKAMWLYHSAISVSLQVGLLSPKQVIDRALNAHTKKPIPLESLEAFIRGVLGWREFIRARYLIDGRSMRSSNELKTQRRLTVD
jgi:deoxyribodipyrimidine photolyase-related protein